MGANYIFSLLFWVCPCVSQHWLESGAWPHFSKRRDSCLHINIEVYSNCCWEISSKKIHLREVSKESLEIVSQEAFWSYVPSTGRIAQGQWRRERERERENTPVFWADGSTAPEWWGEPPACWHCLHLEHSLNYRTVEGTSQHDRRSGQALPHHSHGGGASPNHSATTISLEIKIKKYHHYRFPKVHAASYKCIYPLCETNIEKRLVIQHTYAPCKNSLHTRSKIIIRFTFSTRDEGVDDDLCTIEEVSKLSLPDSQVTRTLNTETILKPKHCLFTQRTVGHLELLEQVHVDSENYNSSGLDCIHPSLEVLFKHNDGRQTYYAYKQHNLQQLQQPFHLYYCAKLEIYLEKVALFWREIIQRDVGRVGVLADQHGMSVAESATPHILAAETYVEALIEQTTNSHCFSCCPVNVWSRLNPVKAITDQALLKTIIKQLRHMYTYMKIRVQKR